MQNQIPKNWQIEPLSFFTNQVTYGFTNPMPTSGLGPFMVTAKDIIDGRINYDTCRKTTVSAYESLLTDKSRPELEDILLTKDGTLGRVALVTQVPLCINQSVALIKVNKDKILPKFLQYLLESPEYQNKMLSEAGGSTIGHIYITRVDKMEIAVPSRSEQEKIVNNIESLDRKIELNNKITKILNEILQTLFKEWFINFHFQGHKNIKTTNSKVGKIPQGWRDGLFGDLITDIRERAGTSFTQLPVLSAVKTGKLIRSGEYFKKRVHSQSLTNYKKVERFNFAYNPARINIGSIGKLEEDIVGVVSPVYAVFKTKNPEHHIFFSLTLSLADTKAYIERFASGSVRQNLDFDAFCKIPIVIPEDEIIVKFNSIYASFKQMLDRTENENKKLITLRDLLLPKLMKGEIRV